MGLHPGNSQKADEWPQESLKNTEILFSSPERGSKTPEWGQQLQKERSFAQANRDGCWDLGTLLAILPPAETQLQFSVSGVEFMSYLLPFAKQKEKHILFLLAWFYVIKEG